MEKKYNLIYIILGSARYSSLGYAGDENSITPNIDILAANSINMINACSAHPLGSPCRASLFTGDYSVKTGMVMDNLRMKNKGNTFPLMLSAEKYNVDFIGKWHLYSDQIGHEDNVRNSYVPRGENRLGFDGYFAAYDNHSRFYAPEAYYHLDSPFKMFYKGYEPFHQTEMAVERIENHSGKGESFALFLSYGIPGGQLSKDNVPEEYYSPFADKSFERKESFSEKGDPHGDHISTLSKKDIPLIEEQQKCYYAMLSAVDSCIGKITEAVKNNGIEKETLIILTSDHGRHFGEHGRKNANSFYDEAVRIPFIIHLPGLKPSQNRTPFSTPDIMPTLLSLLGCKCSYKTQGKDLSENILKGKESDTPCLLMGMGPSDVWGNNREWRAVRSDKYTYAVYLMNGEEFLFDNENDPLQIKNLADDSNLSEIKFNLKLCLYRQMAGIDDVFSKNSYYKKNRVKNRIIL